MTIQRQLIAGYREERRDSRQWEVEKRLVRVGKMQFLTALDAVEPKSCRDCCSLTGKGAPTAKAPSITVPSTNYLGDRQSIDAAG
jgi:hypothetical protein